MITITTLLSVAFATVIRGTASPSNAQAVGDDGIAASPRLRAILNERADAAACRCAEATSFRDAGYKAIGDDGIAEWPKMRAMLNERQAAVGGVGSGVETSTGTGYKGDDGVAASPKMRAILNEQKRRFEVAAVK